MHLTKDALRQLGKTLLLLCAATLSVYGQDYKADRAPDELVIATWNVEWFFDAEQGDNRSKIAKEEGAPNSAFWSWKLQTVAAAIAKMKPTIIGLQEIEGKSVLHQLVAVLKEEHRLSYRIAFVEGFDGSTEQDVGILFFNGCVSYGRREQNNNMFNSQDFYSLSKHIVADFEWDADGSTEKLNLINVHLRARAEASNERTKQAKLVHFLARPSLQRGENVIVMGDMNFESLAGTSLVPDDGIDAITGKLTRETNDDLVDLLTTLPADQRRTHLVLDRQFDRILVSPSMISDDPHRKDWKFSKLEIRRDLVIQGADGVEDHWERRFTKPTNEREVSDHFPLVATFTFQ